jgi:hypothetical protein
MLPFTGGPQTWDELLYLDLSLNLKAEPTVLFRYTHVYFQRIFLSLFPNDIFLGSKVFWLFLTGTTGWLVFQLTYRLSGKNLVTAIIAVYFLLIQKLIFQKYTGVTYADFTVMFLGALMLSLYFSDLSSKTKLFILSFLSVLIFKTKETSLPFMILPLALLVTEIKGFKFSKIMPAIIGGLSGIVLFLLLDTLLLKQPFFSVSPSNFSKRTAFDLFQKFERSEDNWLNYILRSSLIIPFLFYFKTFFELKNKSLSNILVYSVPLTGVVLLVLTMITGNWGIEDRYILPYIPALCIFSALSIVTTNVAIEKESPLKKYGIYFVLFTACFLLSHFVEKFAMIRFTKLGWDNFTFRQAILLPLCVLMLIAAITLQQKKLNAWVLSFLLLFPVILYTESDLKANLIVLKKKDSVIASNLRFQPFSDFKEALSQAENKKILVSKSIYTKDQMLGREQFSLIWMYNIYFKANRTAENLKLDSIYSKNQLLPFDIILMRNKDIDSVSYDSSLIAHYTIKEANQFILFTKK